ncbi:MAG: magnesium chelatase subunit, partial [Acidimicrobiaceae bacterium]|nr:magnesium chelatase subunit [Acidimicrobiaceae bacterium]
MPGQQVGSAQRSLQFPFSAVAGQDEVKLALILAAVDPAIAGVLLRGEKGSAKTTLARALASLL